MTKEQLELVKKALYQAEVIRVKQIEALPKADFVPDDEYKQRISALIEETKKPKAISLKKRIIVLVAAILMLALIITACAFKNEIKGFFVNMFDTFASATSDKDKQYNYTAYKINSLPNGYSEYSSSVVKTSSTTIYSNGKHNIMLYQATISKSVAFFDTKSDEYNLLTISNTKVYYREENSCFYIYWTDPDYMFYLSCPVNIEWATIEEMILSIGEGT